MTRQEFDTWIELHYSELLAVAKHCVNPRANAEPPDALQTAIAGMLASPALLALRRDEDTGSYPIWPWAVMWVRGAAKDARVTHRRKRALTREAKKIVSAALTHV